MSHFYLTLPSNSSFNYFPENTAAHYFTKLPKIMSLEGGWEVGLVSINFPKNWANIGENEKVTFESENLNIEVWVTAGYYPSPKDIAAELNINIRKITKDSTNDFPRFKYSPANRKMYVFLRKNMKCTFTPVLADIFGLSDRKLDMVNNATDDDWFSMTNACNTERNLQSLYIYCDLLENVIVGDTMAPLLAVCDAQGEHGSTIHRNYDKPIYVPLQKKHFDTVEIDIRGNTGKSVPFETGPLMVSLHFRRMKSSYYF